MDMAALAAQDGTPVARVQAAQDKTPAAQVQVYDVWAGKTVGAYDSTYTVTAIPIHGTAFLRLSASAN
jgi:hypothetical protein